MKNMTSTPPNITSVPSSGTPELRLVAVDLYRDIHKGIRAELFAITASAGSIDPSSPFDRAALADHVCSVAGVLEAHAEHEDSFVDPVLSMHLSRLAEQINADHEHLEASFGRITDLARSTSQAATVDQRRLTHQLYLDLARFTGQYLTHLDLEERVVMPGIESAIGVEATGQLHVAIVSSIPPDDMARSLAFMMPAMNLDDRAEMLSGIRMAAPSEAYDATLGLACSVLQPTDARALQARLDEMVPAVAR